MVGILDIDDWFTILHTSRKRSVGRSMEGIMLYNIQLNTVKTVTNNIIVTVDWIKSINGTVDEILLEILKVVDVDSSEIARKGELLIAITIWNAYTTAYTRALPNFLIAFCSIL